MKTLKILFISAVLLSTCSCATTSWAGAVSGTIASDMPNSSKAAILIFIAPVGLPLAIAGDVVGTVFVGLHQGMNYIDPEHSKKHRVTMDVTLQEYYNIPKNFEKSYDNFD